MNLPWVESPFFKDILSTKNLSDENKKLAIDYNNNGFVVLRDFFPEDVTEEIKSEMNIKGYNHNFETNERLMNLWHTSESVKNLASNHKILNILKMLYGREPFPFQTLNFRVGTQQRAHSDTLHFSTIPAKYMCGVWVALEDITPENGAVFYYPKSQNLPEYNFSHFISEPRDTSNSDYEKYENFIDKIVKVSNLKKEPFYAKRGDVLIWSSNIIHGGSEVLNTNSTRYSQVTHYYFKDCIYYTPMFSNMVTHELFLRNNLIDIKTGQKINHTFNGNTINILKTDKSKNLFILNNRLKYIPNKTIQMASKILRKFGFKN